MAYEVQDLGVTFTYQTVVPVRETMSSPASPQMSPLHTPTNPNPNPTPLPPTVHLVYRNATTKQSDATVVAVSGSEKRRKKIC